MGGAPYELIAAATEERIELHSSPALIEELADVLSRAKFAPRLQQAQRTAAQLIEQYRGLVEVVSPEPSRPLSWQIPTTMRCSPVRWPHGPI